MWQRYYTRWRSATRERLDPRLLELMSLLLPLCPPATVIDKMRYSAFAGPRLLRICGSGGLMRCSYRGLKPMSACWRGGHGVPRDPRA